jgi:hypothetical protein
MKDKKQQMTDDRCSRCKNEPLDRVARVWGTRAKACLETPCRFEEESK